MEINKFRNRRSILYYLLPGTREMEMNKLRNRRSIHRPVPANVWWREKEVITIWTIWIGGSQIPPLVQAAMESCKTAHPNDRDQHGASAYAREPHLHYRVVTDEDLADPEGRLKFSLHPSFFLLDNIEKSDYLRAELLHHHGGFYLDADVLCLQSFRDILGRSPFDVAGAQDRTHYGPYPSLSQNALGPFRPVSPTTTWWHDALHVTMDSLTPQLKACHENYGGTIPYPIPRWYGTSICGIEWGGVIDFVKPVWKALAEDNSLGHDLAMCDVEGNQVGWGYSDNCHIVHLGTAGDFYERHDW
eukprot:CAMPEP_0198305094 /NCGR_PEP_ID=MMETSP1449-20131203/57729_1 /TAXON_ID=420275 /ORGANISM="Attheya septentrionalis, Strain CCMP2084" /LENGTH=301 /DNA_ID=CAMNT_0044007625 /DNA_START=943 /DNA_END=1845 /DNA_ORIENTATION=+